MVALATEPNPSQRRVKSQFGYILKNDSADAIVLVPVLYTLILNKGGKAVQHSPLSDGASVLERGKYGRGGEGVYTMLTTFHGLNYINSNSQCQCT